MAEDTKQVANKLLDEFGKLLSIANLRLDENDEAKLSVQSLGEVDFEIDKEHHTIKFVCLCRSDS